LKEKVVGKSERHFIIAKESKNIILLAGAQVRPLVMVKSAVLSK
jgi:hypothetical protein